MHNLAKKLDELTPGHLPEAVFEAIAKLVVIPTYVVVPLFRRGQCTRVALTRRAVDEKHYAGMLHPPGKILLSTDSDLETVFARLKATELKDFDILSKPVFVTHFFEKITRGREISMVHYLEVGDPKSDMPNYDPVDLPKDVIKSDIPRIIAAVQAFNQALSV